MEKENNIIKILRFLENDLTDSEMRHVEQRLKSEPDFAKVYQDVKFILEKLPDVIRNKLNGDENTREELLASIIAEFDIDELGTKATSKEEVKFQRRFKAAIESDKQSKQNERRRFRLITIATLAAAAALALLITILVPEKDFDYLLTAYYQPSEDLTSAYPDLSVRGNINDGLVLFRAGSFSAARGRFETQIQAMTSDTSLAVMYAITLYETGDREEGLNMLRKYANDLSGKASLDAAWYYALLSFREGNDPEGVQQLEKIAAASSYHAAGARKLLKLLNKF